MASFEKKLPIEQWQQVLRNVSCGDLCNVMLTSRHMNRVASWPELWAGMRVNMGKMKEEGLAQLYSINRFKRIKEIDFSWMNFTSMELEGLFTDIPGSPLQSINFTGIDLRDVPPELLANSVGRLQTITLRITQLSTTQCIKVLETILSSTLLIYVDLDNINLSGVPPVLLARAVSCLETVKLHNSRLTTDQCIKLLEASISSTSLVNIELSLINLRDVPANLLARAVSRLKTVNLHDSRLTTDQCIEVLEASISSTSLLVNIILSKVNLRDVPANLLASAVSRLKTVNLSVNLTTDQCTKVLEASMSSTTLESIILHTVDLSGVPANLLASAVSRLKTVHLSTNSLTTEQCIALLRDISSSTTLKHVYLEENDIRNKIPTDLQYLITALPSHVKISDIISINQIFEEERRRQEEAYQMASRNRGLSRIGHAFVP